MNNINRIKYKCDLCGVEFESEKSDEEARNEAEKIFGKPVDEWKTGAAVACNDCYKKIVIPALFESGGLEEVKKQI